VRWERLFDDLEAQMEAAAAAELAAEVQERTRFEQAQVSLADRLFAWQGESVRLDLMGGFVLAGRLERAAQQWVVLQHGRGPALVPLAAVVTVTGLGGLAATGDRNSVLRRLALTAVLRAVARDRGPVHIDLIDGRTVAGTVDAAGADHVDLAEHPPDEPRRTCSVLRVVTIATSAIAAVRATSASSALHA
jgi:hypothetical protein